ncbi:BrnA antitoxin family protein [candidate division KSB1 bacterium]|nr:BrnA antitoxin family protein [candidate division KSB1 bacterium]
MKDEDIDYSDIPPLTDEQFAAMRPLQEVLPGLVQRKKRVTLELDTEVVKWFKQSSRSKQRGSYHALINAALCEHMMRQRQPAAR